MILPGPSVASVAGLGCIALLLVAGIITAIVVGVTQRGELDLSPGGAPPGVEECGAFVNLRSDIFIDCEPTEVRGVCDEQNRCVSTDVTAFPRDAVSFSGPQEILCDSIETQEACATIGQDGECTCFPRLCVRDSSLGKSLFVCDPLLNGDPVPEPPQGFVFCGRFVDVPVEEQPVVLDCALRPAETFCDTAAGCSAQSVLAGDNQAEFAFVVTNACGAGSNDECDADSSSCDCAELVTCVRNVRGTLATFECDNGQG